MIMRPHLTTSETWIRAPTRSSLRHHLRDSRSSKRKRPWRLSTRSSSIWWMQRLAWIRSCIWCHAAGSAADGAMCRKTPQIKASSEIPIALITMELTQVKNASPSLRDGTRSTWHRTGLPLEPQRSVAVLKLPMVNSSYRRGKSSIQQALARISWQAGFLIDSAWFAKWLTADLWLSEI